MRTPNNETVSSDIDEMVPDFDDGTDARGKAARRSTPLRKCVLTGRIAPRDTLLRLAVGPGPDGKNTVLPDALAKAPGRGAWIGVSRAELEEAIASGHLKGALARGFKSAPPAIPADLAEMAQAAITRAFTDRLGIEYRSGNVLAGSDRIAEAARMGKVHWLAHASDAGEDGSRKLDQAWRVGEDAEGTGMAGISLPLDRIALSVALGRDNTVHLAVTDAAAARRIAVLTTRLDAFLGRSDASAPPAKGPGDRRASEP